MIDGSNVFMDLRVDDLYKLQFELDQRIFDIHNVNRKQTQRERMLALLIELGEMINETRCFKFWSNKGPNYREVILEEYGDGLHFLLSLGIDLNDQQQIKQSMVVNDDVVGLILKVYQKMIDLSIDFNIESLNIAFAYYLALAEKLDFSADDIRTYYFKKNQINHQRQDHRY